MVAANLESLLTYLKGEGFEPEHQKETEQVFFVLKKPPREFPIFVRIMPGGELLQLLAFFPCQLQEGAVGETARLLHLLNKELDLPGFGMDEQNGVVFFRTLTLIRDGKVLDEDLGRFIAACDRVCESFSGAVEAVASGQMNLKQLLEKADELSKQQ